MLCRRDEGRLGGVEVLAQGREEVTEVLLILGGVAGIAAAEAAAASGKRVMLADENAVLGGVADISAGTIDGKPQGDWVKAKAAQFAKTGNVHVLTRTTVVGFATRRNAAHRSSYAAREHRRGPQAHHG